MRKSALRTDRKIDLSPFIHRGPGLPPLLLGRDAALAGFAFVVGAIHGASLGGELGELHPVVTLDHDLERFAHRRRAVEFLDRYLGALRGGDIGATAHVVTRHGDFVVGEAVTQVDHAPARVVGVFAVGVLLDHGQERGERTARLGGRPLVEVHPEPALEEVWQALEVREALEVPGVVDARVGRVFPDEGIGRVDGRFGLAGAVIGIDHVQARLARLGRERISRHQRFVDPDGERIVGLDQRLVGALVDHRRVGHLFFAGFPGLAARQGQAQGQQNRHK